MREKITIEFCLRLCLALVALFSVSCAATKSGGTFLSSYEGFEQESRFEDAVTYKGDLEKLADYDRVYIESVKVYPPNDELKAGLLPELGAVEDSVTKADDISPAELQKLEDAFRSALNKEIGGKRELATGPGPRTISVRAAVVDLKANDPLLFAASYVPYVSAASTASSVVTGSSMGAGYVTIEAEILDSATRERFFAIVDRSAGSKLRLADGLSRWGQVEAAFQKWSREFSGILNGEVAKAGAMAKAKGLAGDTLDQSKELTGMATDTVKSVGDGVGETVKSLPGLGFLR